MNYRSLFRSINFWSIVFFAAYLIVGLIIYKDYGISWDERVQRANVGVATYNYVFHNDNYLFDNIEKNYGPVFETFLVVVEKAFSFNDTRDIYFIRHLFTFLFFYSSVIVFFFFCRELFKNSTLALISCCMLVISPHIFAHSFYNSKDIPFLSFFLFAVCSMFFLQKKYTWPYVIIHALATALAIDTRILGMLIPVFTITIISLNYFIERSITLKRVVVISSSYLFLTVIFTVAFWPMLWPSPVNNFMEAFSLMSKFSAYENTNLYLGSYIPADSLPWHYLLVWMGITLPIPYIVFFLVGVVMLIIGFLKLNVREYYVQNKFFCIILLLFLAPLIAVIIMHSVTYDEWRHVFFIYPMFIIISIYGIRSLLFLIKNSFTHKFVYAVILSAFLFVGVFMVANHPHQNVYFNCAVRDMSTAKENFELDYWGLSYKQGLEYILKNDTSSRITINGSNDPCILALMILDPADRKRLTYEYEIEKCDYYLTNYRWHKHDYSLKEYYSVKIGEAKILSVFKMQ